jgi:hypothetical protein
MSTPATGLGLKPNQVEIKDHPSDPKKLAVPGTDPFWVSKSQNEVAEWYCKRTQQNHQHGPNCFTVRFDKNGSPFASNVFTSDNNGKAISNDIVVEPGSIIYQYRIQATGKDDLDPGGGVKP